MGALKLQNFQKYQRVSIETVERHESAWNWLTHNGENSAKLKRLASPKEAHEMPTGTHTDEHTQIHIVTPTTTFIHAAQETTRRLVNFWIADSQKIQHGKYTDTATARDTDTTTTTATDTTTVLLTRVRQFVVVSDATF